jgi:hypothetical protein
MKTPNTSLVRAILGILSCAVLYYPLLKLISYSDIFHLIVRELDPKSDGLVLTALLSGLLSSIYPLWHKDIKATIATIVLGPLLAIGLMGFLWNMQV